MIPLGLPDPQRHLLQRLAACRAFAGDIDLRGDHQLALIVGQLDLGALCRGLTELCVGLPAERARPWMGNFTKCLILSGDPGKLAQRFPALHVNPGGGSGWLGPLAADEMDPLRRLLRPLRTARPLEAAQASFAPATRAAARATEELRVTIATRALALEEVLVTLVHTVAESCLLGHLDSARVVHLCTVEDLEPPPRAARYVRAHKGSHDDAFRYHSTLTAAP